MFRKIFTGILAAVLSVSTASAQLDLNYTTFVPGQTISSAQFTENFTNISNKSLDRTGGATTGEIDFDATVDINSTFVVGSGNVQPFDSTGKIQAISATYFASLSGANLTGLLETNIADGALLARVGSTETITGAWTFSTAPVLTGANLTGVLEANITDGALLARVGSVETIAAQWTFTVNPIINGVNPWVGFVETGQAADESTWLTVVDGKAWQVRAYTDNFLSSTGAITATRGTGTAISDVTLAATTITFSGNTTTSGTSVLNGAVTTNSTLAVGTNLSVGADMSVTGTLTTGVFSPTELRINGDADLRIYQASTNVLALGRPNIGAGNAGINISTVADNVSLVAGTSAFEFTTNDFYATGTFKYLGFTSRFDTIYLVNNPDVSSDRRLKQNIKDVSLGIEFIDALKPKEYQLIKSPGIVRYGFIAQDLQALGFKGVSTGNDGMLGLRYEELIAPVVKGLQEVHAETHTVAEQNKMLLELVLMLNDRLEKLEKIEKSRKAAE